MDGHTFEIILKKAFIFALVSAAIFGAIVVGIVVAVIHFAH